VLALCNKKHFPGGAGGGDEVEVEHPSGEETQLGRKFSSTGDSDTTEKLLMKKRSSTTG